MGDRANVAIELFPNGERIYFYTHWNGTDLPEVVRKALARRQRWDDPSYLARIIFSEMIDGNVKSETGFGISTQAAADAQHPVLVVNVPTQEVSVFADKRQTYTFSEFVELGHATWSLLKKKVETAR